MMQTTGAKIPLFDLPRLAHRRRSELGLIFSLSLMLLLFFFLRDVHMPVTVREPELIILTVENIPQTRQAGARRPPPPKPAIPIPIDSELIPEDETIEPTPIDLQSVGAAASAGHAYALGGGQIIPPRPLAFVVPEYPEEDRKKNLRGEVKISLEIDVTGKVVKAVVMENTTGSPRCAQAALRAALASRFTPARNAQGPVPYWLIQPYTFDLKN
jgi:TonB family protein